MFLRSNNRKQDGKDHVGGKNEFFRVLVQQTGFAVATVV
jgi:hypothetical protein